MSSILRSSKFVRYFFGLARNIIISNRHEIDGGLLQRSQHLSGIFSNNFSTNIIRFQLSPALEDTVRQLDEDARRTGRVSVAEIEEALQSIKHTRKATASQTLMVIRCCGNLVPEEIPEQRTKLVEEIWKTLENIGVPLDISHYNALLKVYLENEHKFSPTEFLLKLEKNGIEPNRVTYQRLIAGFCQQGDIAGATQILEFMKEKQLPVSEAVFNALILGHSKANDMESAEGILKVMKQANLEPSNETYTTLLRGYAEHGDGEAIQRILKECKVKDVLLSDREVLEIGFAASVNGHDQLLDEILKNIRRSMGYNQDAANIILRLLTAGKDEAAYKVFLSLNPNLRSEGGPNMSGHIFIKQLVKCNRPVDQIVSWCERLAKDGHTSHGLGIAVDASFHHKNTDLTLDLLRIMKQRTEPIRPHYFWPSLVTAGKASDFNCMINIMKQMINEFEIQANLETLRDYFMPYVPSSKSSTEVLTSLDSVGVKRAQAVVSMVNHLISKRNLKEAAELAYQYPVFNYRASMTTNQLVSALAATNDVPSVVGLLHVLTNSQFTPREDKDEEEESGNADDIVTRFLVNLVSHSESYKHTSAVLKEMLKRGLPISNVCAETVENKLQGKQLTSEILELLSKLSSGEITPQAIKRVASGPVQRTPESLEKIKERMKANNETVEKIIGINRSLYQMYCYEGDIENALKIKKELVEEFKQEVTTGLLAGLLDAYCIKGDVEEAKNTFEKIKASATEFELDSQKILRLAKLYTENNQIDEAISSLKTVKSRDIEGKKFSTRNMAFQLLQAAAETYKDPEIVKNLLNLLAELQYIEVNNAMLGPIMKAYLLRDDVEGALKEFEECVKKHRATPYKTELTARFIEKEDATNLQTLVDLSTEVHGEVNSLYDLVLCFIQCGKIRQARKILETPGLTSRNNRLMLVCERYKKEGKSDYLEGLIEVTKDVPFIDRSEIYNCLLDTYCQRNEVEKALEMWTKMQDENVNVTDDFLVKLGNLLEENGRPVPFKIPKKAEASTTPVSKSVRKESSTKVSYDRASLIAAIRNSNVDEALEIRDQREKNGKQLNRNENNQLIELLVQQSRLKEATEIFTSLTEAQRPGLRIHNFLISRLAAKGELELLDRIAQHLPIELQKVTSFSNKYMGAAVAAGKEQRELDQLENEIDAASSNEDIDVLVSKFPTGGILAVLESSPSYYDQVVRIVDKHHKKGSTRPANTLVMYHLTSGDVEKARQLYQQYNLNNSSQLMFRPVVNKARVTRNPRLIEELLVLVKDAPAVTPEVKGVIYSNLINLYNKSGDYETALQKLDEAAKILPLELFYTSTLVKLKDGLEANNKTFKYTIPPKKTKDDSSSSSSSSSETEPKKSVASN